MGPPKGKNSNAPTLVTHHPESKWAGSQHSRPLLVTESCRPASFVSQSKTLWSFSDHQTGEGGEIFAQICPPMFLLRVDH